MKFRNWFVAALLVGNSAALAAKPTPPKIVENPPPVQTTVVAPPTVVPAPIVNMTRSESPGESARIQRAMQEIVALEVEVSAGGERLWSGVLRVNSQQSANYTSSLRQARPPCPGMEDAPRYYGNGEQIQLNVGIERRGWENNVDGFNFQISWVHPRQACDNGGGQATVGFNQGFVLRPGASTQLNGDGGLTIRITRRN